MKKFKRFLSSVCIISCLGIGGAVTSCGETPVVQNEITSISIANKSELSSKWVVGEANRIISLTINPTSIDVNDALKDNKISITSSDSSVVKVEGLVLSALKEGEATISVTCGDLSDSVKITVSPVPELEITSVAITNKEDLKAKWTLGDEARTLEVDFETINGTISLEDALAQKLITITSSDSEVISVNNLTLTALKVGNATITVSAGEYVDSVELEVLSVPELEITGVAINNKDELTAKWIEGEADRTLDINLTTINGTITVEQALAANKLTITSSDSEVVSVSSLTLKALKHGVATISVSAGSIKDEVTITVDERVYEVPSLEIASYQNEVLTDVQVTLPEATSMADGVDISDNVEISTTSQDVTLNDNVAIFNKEGNYEFTYKVINPNDETKFATKNITYTVYKNWITEYGLTDSATYENALSNNPSIVSKNTGTGVVALNVEASKYYYVETTVNAFQGDAYWLIGFTHLVGNPGENQRWVETAIVLNDSGGATTFRVNERYAWDKITTVAGVENLVDTRKVFNDFDVTNFKLGMARNEDQLYLFLNDNYVGSYFSNDLDCETLPGIFTTADGVATEMSEKGVTFTNFKASEGKTAVNEKLNELLGEGHHKMYQSYVPATWATDSPEKYDVSYSSENGVNINFNTIDADKNANMITNYIYFNSPFKVSFDYKAEEYGEDGAMFLEVRNMIEIWQDNPIAAIGAHYQRQMYVADYTTDYPDGQWWGYYKGFDFNNENADDSLGARYTLECVYDEAIGYYFNMSIQSLADPSKVLTKEVITGNAFFDGTTFILQWNNINVKGTYSNITYELIK